MIGIIGAGIRFSFGVFFESFETQFEINRAVTSGLYSVYMLLSGLGAVLGGWALDRYGTRKTGFAMVIFIGSSLLLSSQVQTIWQLYITYSLLLSFGSGSLFPFINSTVSRWFIKKRGFAIGISSSAGAIGQIVMVPLASLLLVHFEWRLSFIILGLIALAIMLPSTVLIKRDPSDLGLLPDGIKTEPDKDDLTRVNVQRAGLRLSQAYKTREFWYLLLMWLFFSMSLNLILTQAIPHAMDLGISYINAALILSLIGVGGVFGRIGIGRISDTIGRRAPAIICAVLQAGLLVWLIWIRELWMFYLFAVIFGLTWGGIGSQVTVMISDIFGFRSLGVIMGTISVGYDIGAAIGPAMGGIVFDVTNNYSLAFTVCAIGMLLIGIFAILIRPEPLKPKAEYTP